MNSLKLRVAVVSPLTENSKNFNAQGNTYSLFTVRTTEKASFVFNQL